MRTKQMILTAKSNGYMALVVIVLILFFCGEIQALMLFDNGTTNYLNGAYMGGLSVPARRSADDFTVDGAGWVLDSIEITAELGGSVSDDQFVQWDSTDIEVMVFSEESGAPNTLLNTFYSSASLGPVTGHVRGNYIRLLTGDLGGLYLEPETYFLSVFAYGPPGNDNNLFWDTCVESNTFSAHSSPDGGNTWVTNSDPVVHHLNFRLFGEQIQPVPEPSTILLVATGLIGLAGFRKKFKK